MIIWRGAGFVGAIVVIVCLLGGQYILDSVMGQGYTSSHKWAASVFILTAAAINWLIGINLEKFPPREWVDPKTQQTVLVKEKHTIFFMSLKYFAMLLAIWAIFLAVKNVPT